MKAALSYSRIGAAYGISGQAVRQLSKRHGVDSQVFADPEALLTVLLDKGNRSALRRRLTDPAARNEIASQLQTTESNDQ